MSRSDTVKLSTLMKQQPLLTGKLERMCVVMAPRPIADRIINIGLVTSFNRGS